MGNIDRIAGLSGQVSRRQIKPRIIQMHSASGMFILRPRFSSVVEGVAPTRYNGGVPFSIRPFEKGDFDTLWRIDQACFDPQLAYSRLELAFYMKRPGAFTLVAESDGVILGFIVAESRRKTGHIITIDVIAKARRTGAGSHLLRAAEERLSNAGAVAVALETPVNNLAAIQFYKAHGYFVEKTVAGYYSGQLDALVMSKDLALAPAK
jgi:ribosomal-protein-alanine N-acetyltransferase